MYVTTYFYRDAWRVYKTKIPTPVHKRLRDGFQGETTKDPERVITEFVPGMPLGTRAIVRGGVRIPK